MKKKAPDLPLFSDGAKVRLLKDITWTPFQPGKGYGKEAVLLPAGTTGRVSGTINFGNYNINFGGFNLHVYPSRLEAVQDEESRR